MNTRKDGLVVLPALVLANLAVLLLSVGQAISTGMPTMTFDWGLVPERLTESLMDGSLTDIGYNLLTLFTSTFLHAGFDHWFSNMVLLIVMGILVERELGPARFLGIYLVSGVAGSLCHYVFHAFSPYPMIGASGAISGILGAFLACVLCLGQRITMLRLLGSVFVVQWIVGQFAEAITVHTAGSGVAYNAHLGGFFCGLFVTIAVASTLRKSRQKAEQERARQAALEEERRRNESFWQNGPEPTDDDRL